MWLELIILFVVAVVALDRWLRDENFNKIPGPKGCIILGNSLDFIMDPVKLFYRFRTLANKYKRLFKLKMGIIQAITIYHPEDVEAVISGTTNNCKGFLYDLIRPWLQDGLLLSDGAKWQRRRKILTPTFHFNILRHFHLVLEENSGKLVESLQSEVDQPKTDISAFIADFTLNSICETAMGTKLDPETSDFGRRYKEAIHTLGQLLVYRAQRVWMYPSFVHSLTSICRKQKVVLKLLYSFRDSIINKRRETSEFQNTIIDVENYEQDESNPKKKLAMLDLLLQAEKNGTIDAAGIGEEVDTFMFEGHDTTATALLFTFMMLANNPDAQEKCVEEINQIFESSTRAATTSDLVKMKYLECCIKEALRLYPPVHFVMRKISHDLKLKDYVVTAGTECGILLYDLHRRDDQFLEPLEFRPERFLVEPTWHPYSYIPFSAGPRNCIGQRFAMMEMKLAVSAVLRRYRLLPITRPSDIIFITDFILRSKQHIYVKFENRV